MWKQCTPVTHLGASPFELLFHEPPIPVTLRKMLNKDEIQPLSFRSVKSIEERVQEGVEMHHNMHEKMEQYAQKIAARRDMKSFKVGDKVRFVLYREVKE